MTLSSTTQKVTYNGDGSGVIFTVTFGFVLNSHIVAILRDAAAVETTWVEGSDYTLTGAGGTSGTLTATTAPAIGEKLVIKRAPPETQLSALPAGGPLPTATVEQMVDLAVMIVQAHSEEISRSLLLPETASLSGLTMPEPGAGELIRYNTGGTDLETVAIADLNLTLTTILTSLANLDFLRYDSGQAAFINRTPANARTDLNVPGLNADGGVTLTDANDGAGQGPLVKLFRDSSTPVVSDVLARIDFSGNNVGLADKVYASVFTTILDPSTGLEDGRLAFKTVVAGTIADRMRLDAGLAIGAPTGGDQGAGTLNVDTGLFIDGVQAGRLVQVVQTQDGEVATGTTTIPFDDTIPQNTEGVEFMTLAITPKSANSRLKIDVVAQLNHSGAVTVLEAVLFRDAIANALAIGRAGKSTAGPCTVGFSHDMASPGTSATTFKVRCGVSVAGTVTFNGTGGTRDFGGALASSIIITEYLP